MNMIKKNLTITILLYFIMTVFSYGAASSGSSNDGDAGVSIKSNYDNASYLIKRAKKLEKKKKINKAKKRYQKALKYLLKSNKKKPNQANTLNYLGFTNRKLGNYEVAEKYYLEGLAINPNHNEINEYLGELYIQTNRIDLAKERLDILKDCDCEEYQELKELIEKN